MHTLAKPSFICLSVLLGLSACDRGADEAAKRDADRTADKDKDKDDKDKDEDKDDKDEFNPFAGMANNPLAAMFANKLDEPGPYDPPKKSTNFAADLRTCAS